MLQTETPKVTPVVIPQQVKSAYEAPAVSSFRLKEFAKCGPLIPGNATIGG